MHVEAAAAVKPAAAVEATAAAEATAAVEGTTAADARSGVGDCGAAVPAAAGRAAAVGARTGRRRAPPTAADPATAIAPGDCRATAPAGSD